MNRQGQAIEYKLQLMEQFLIFRQIMNSHNAYQSILDHLLMINSALDFMAQGGLKETHHRFIKIYQSLSFILLLFLSNFPFLMAENYKFLILNIFQSIK